LILGTGLVPGQNALVIPRGNLLIGNTIGRGAAPNGATFGNIEVNDIYVRGAAKWASQLRADDVCVNTTWAPNTDTTCIGELMTQTSNCGNTRAVNGTLSDTSCDAPPAPAACVASVDTCYSMVGGRCDDGYYLSGSTSCCSLDACKAYTAKKWINDKLAINYVQNDSDDTWGITQKTSFTTKYAIDDIRVRGFSDDGGYCYVYWGTGHLATTRHDGTIGVYSVNNLYYDGRASISAKDATPLTTGTGKDASLVTTGTGASASVVYAPTTYNTCPTATPFFSNDGTARLCQLNYDAGAMMTKILSFSGRTGPGTIPAGTTVTLQGAHVIGNLGDSINCSLDIQYAE
ncbi:MAG: hypothetical protein UY31_C0067G0001, partial [Candidatus Wolfebacteria bacterium GW2011_GWE1_48_7]